VRQIDALARPSGSAYGNIIKVRPPGGRLLFEPQSPALLAVAVACCGFLDLCAGPSHDVLPGLGFRPLTRNDAIVALVPFSVLRRLVAARVVAEFMGGGSDRADDRTEPAPKLARDQEMLIRIRRSSRQSGETRASRLLAGAAESILEAKPSDRGDLELGQAAGGEAFGSFSRTRH
jgi:hypothetical protein